MGDASISETQGFQFSLLTTVALTVTAGVLIGINLRADPDIARFCDAAVGSFVTVRVMRWLECRDSKSLLRFLGLYVALFVLMSLFITSVIVTMYEGCQLMNRFVLR